MTTLAEIAVRAVVRGGRRVAWVTLPLLALFVCGCADRQTVRAQWGAVYYFDGAGGGGPVVTWARSVEDGLREAGYHGAFHNVRWQTGLGALADHETDASYKRGEAAVAARRIAEYTREHPGAPVYVIGLSAGSAVAVFALEDLPDGVTVDNVALLSSSLSAHYDLTPALAHVSGRAYITVSPEDEILRATAPVLGTADELGHDPVGLVGFRPGAGAARVTYLEWQPVYEAFGWDGSHTDVTDERFIARVVAPRLLR